MGRLLLLAVVMLVLAPGTWVRTTPVANSDARQILSVGRLQVAPRTVGETELAGAWLLTSPNMHFGGLLGDDAARGRDHAHPERPGRFPAAEAAAR